MPPSAEHALPQLAELFDMLSDPTRLHIVLLLARGERNVTSLCEEIGQRQPLVSHHLGLLRMSRVIMGKRNGKQIIYSLQPNAKVSGGKLKIAVPPFSVTVDGV